MSTRHLGDRDELQRLMDVEDTAHLLLDRRAVLGGTRPVERLVRRDDGGRHGGLGTDSEHKALLPLQEQAGTRLVAGDWGEIHEVEHGGVTDRVDHGADPLTQLRLTLVRDLEGPLQRVLGAQLGRRVAPVALGGRGGRLAPVSVVGVIVLVIVVLGIGG